MNTNNLRINQLSPKAYECYLNYLTILDQKDLNAYAKLLADDVTLHMNNNDPVVGKEEVVQGLAYYWPTFASLEHELLNIYGTDSSFMLEALNHYTRNDGKPVTLRAVAFTDRNEKGLVTSVRVYKDNRPLFE